MGLCGGDCLVQLKIARHPSACWGSQYRSGRFQRQVVQIHGVKLMGFGHRVYKNYDPRARIVKEKADKILGKRGRDDDLLDIAKQLEETC